MISTLIYAISILMCLAYIDHEHLKDNDYIESHVSRVVLRILICLAMSSGWLDLVGLLSLFAVSYSPILNVIRGLNLWHLGETAYFDRFWNSVHPVLYKIFVIAGLIESLMLIRYATI